MHNTGSGNTSANLMRLSCTIKFLLKTAQTPPPYVGCMWISGQEEVGWESIHFYTYTELTFEDVQFKPRPD